MQVKVGSKGRIVIPHKIRRKYSILPGKELQIEEEEGVIRLLVPAKLADLCGTWDMDLNEVRRAIEDLREHWRE
ncbi:MAG: AbrB/MazE/SpoVT family DNA-binding domain-containing protein [Candidatus Thermoplasmatota archaeon]|nr:AbrB/MazE/SpoVT family DNA-binding domain-containing protein [Candidatus Thermoplasmatota archaeon]